jgi:acetylornithine deacetylase
LAAVLTSWGFEVDLHEAAPGRPNVIARVGPRSGGTLMFNGHIDTVDVVGMVHAPFDADDRGGRLYGRGSCDMKAGVAAMCAAAARAADAGLGTEVLIAAVVDEEFESLGTRDLVARGIRADAAIVTEPTRLEIHPAHRGFTWAEFELRGRAAHGSRYDLGIDAIAHAGIVLDELARLERETLVGISHPLLGHASLHASAIRGGSGWSTYPDLCILGVERRTLPGEAPVGVMAQFDDACERARRREPAMKVSVRHVFSQRPSDVAIDAPVVNALGRAISASGRPVKIAGMSAWTDAALLNDAGIPAICFGPGDITLAHAAEEWVPIDEVESAATILTGLALGWAAERSR